MKEYTVRGAHIGSSNAPIPATRRRGATVQVEQKVTPSGQILVDVNEAAHMLKCGRSSMYQLFAHGEIRTIKVGRLLRVPVSELERFVQDKLSAAEWGSIA